MHLSPFFRIPTTATPPLHRSDPSMPTHRVAPPRTTLTRIVLLGLAGIAATLIPLAPSAHAAPTIERFTTPGGTEVIHAPMEGADYSTIILFWPNDAVFADPATSGLLTLGTRLPLMEAGGRSFEEVSEELNDAREGVSLSNSLSGTALFLSAEADDDAPFAEAAPAARAALSEPTLDPDDLSELQDEIVDNLAATERDPAIMAERAVGAFIGGSDPRLSAITNRPVEVVTDVTADDVRTFLDAAIHASPIVVAAGVAGEDAIAGAVDAILADLPPAPDTVSMPEPIPYERAGQTLVVNAPEAEVTIVTVPLVLPLPGQEAGAAIGALADGDGSRLFTLLREELGATYGVELRTVPLLADAQLLSFVAAVPPERAGEVAELIRGAIGDVRTNGITADELEAVREQSLVAIEQRDADPGTVAGALLDGIVRSGEGGVTVLNDFDRTLASMTVDNVNAALATQLPHAATTVIVTPEPDAVEADCTVDTPEDAANCP